jgi:hypothetical protein
MTASLTEIIIHDPVVTVKHHGKQDEKPGIIRGHSYEHLPRSSDPDVLKSLQSVLTEIRSDLFQKTSNRNMAYLALRNTIADAKENRMMTLCKLAFIALCGYAEKNFVVGILAGEILLKNTATSDLFATSVAIQNNAGGAITNAVQDVQFARDGIVILGSMYFVLFRKGYRQARHEMIDSCYDKYFTTESLSIDQKNMLLKLKDRERDYTWLW